MEINNKAQFEKVVADAKAKAGGNKRWIAAIDKAADALLNGKWIVTELQRYYVFTTESGKTYRANGVCQCEAFFRDQPCKHRAGARLLDLYREAEAVPCAECPVCEEEARYIAMHPMFAADELDEPGLRLELADEKLAADIAAAPRLTRVVEQDYKGIKYAVTYYDGWMI
jgi:hypothetical protein